MNIEMRSNYIIQTICYLDFSTADFIITKRRYRYLYYIGIYFDVCLLSITVVTS